MRFTATASIFVLSLACVAAGIAGCGGSDDKKSGALLPDTAGSGGSSSGASGKSGGSGAGAAGASGAGAGGAAGLAGASGAGAGGAAGGGAAGASGAGAGGAPGDCTDKKKSGDETDIDCGGSCSKMGKTCAIGSSCLQGADCASGVCVNKVCVQGSCVDTVKNGDETDVDCGGASCLPCGDMKSCVKGSDCTSGICDAMKQCAVPTCTDKVKNGDETDIDCGGTCVKCDSGAKCKVAGDCKTAVCGNDMTCKCPTGMASIPRVDGGSYCIDQAEATYKSYQAFWTANPVANDTGECAWNTTYTPKDKWPPAPGDVDFPVRYVDWCDAKAYCTWSGKHLCGLVGAVDAVPFASHADPKKSEWFNACSAMGNNLYPYGATYDKTACVGADGHPMKDLSVPTPRDIKCNADGICAVQDTTGLLVTCLGGAPDLYGMSGNVAEWENSCNGTAGATDQCHIRGGGAQSAAEDLKCGNGQAVPRNTTSAFLGIRCCL